jgi:hypothetical protein
MNDTRKAHGQWARQDRIYGLIQLACAAIAVVTAVYASGAPVIGAAEPGAHLHAETLDRIVWEALS